MNYSSILVSTCLVLLQSSYTKGQWTAVWRADFNGADGSQPSTSEWIYDTGLSYPGGPMNWGTGEVQSYTNRVNNIKHDGRGNLLIIPRRNGNTWTSARIETRRSFKPPPGGRLLIEARIQMPNVRGTKAVGYWPAFWALGAPFRGNYKNWPSIGEIDIMENVNGQNFVRGALHCGVGVGGPCNENSGRGNQRSCPGSSCQSGFHTYRVIWSDRSKSIRWFVDGMEYHRVNRNDIGTQTWNQITRHGYFLLLNVAIGGGYPTGVYKSYTPLRETEPGHPMVIDYVAVHTAQG